jgi:hypothetical protein
VRRIRVELDPVALPQSLPVQFRVEGDAARLQLPPSGLARRADGLWQHSCFEAFLSVGPNGSYHEFNLAPSGEWALYRFGVRRGERSFPEVPEPRIAFRRLADGCELSATLPVSALPELAVASGIHAGFAAVIESGDGALSYWALAHAGPAPDFHDPSTFTLRVLLR